jgi:two-component system, cell cycle sensor histidine kinase and response regulator CckA
VHQSGGTIHVDSRIGEGSRFMINLPVAEPATIAPKLIARADEYSAGGAEHILVVEDDLALRSLVAHILRAVGYRVAEALSPEHALQTIAQPDIRIDLLLTDVVMPRMSGGELATRARNIRPNLKLALMSGYPEEDIQEKCGDVTLIEKPFTPEALVEHVRFVLRCTEEDVA